MPQLRLILLGYIGVQETECLAEYLMRHRRVMEIDSYQLTDEIRLTALLETNPYILFRTLGLSDRQHLLLKKNGSREMILYNKILGNMYENIKGILNLDDYYISYTNGSYIYSHYSETNPMSPSENPVWMGNIFPILGIAKQSKFKTEDGRLVGAPIISRIAQFLDPLEMISARIEHYSTIDNDYNRNWYTEDNISTLLHHYVSEDRYSIIAQTQINDGSYRLAYC